MQKIEPIRTFRLLLITIQALLHVFSLNVAADPAREQRLSDFFVKPGKPEIRGQVVPGGSAQPIVIASVGDRYQLIYFGTAHRIGSCAADLLLLQRAVQLLESRCGVNVAAKVSPVLIYPEHDESSGLEPRNLDLYVTPKGARITGLSAPMSEVIALANNYQASYQLSSDHVVASHTRSIYFMAPEGQNLAIFEPGTPFGLITEQLILLLGQLGEIAEDTNSTCNPD